MKRIIFKFWGGPLDGTTVAGERAKNPDVRRYYALTHHGRVGQRFRMASEYAVNMLIDEQIDEQIEEEAPPHHFQQHVYEVVDRIDNGKVVLVRVEYIQPPASSHDPTSDPTSDPS